MRGPGWPDDLPGARIQQPSHARPLGLAALTEIDRIESDVEAKVVSAVDTVIGAAGRWRPHFSLDSFADRQSARVGGGLRMPLQRSTRAP